MNNAVFALHLLPDNVRLQVIKNFDHLHLISFSLISSKSKALVQSFNVKIENLTVSVRGSLRIRIKPTVERFEIAFTIYQNYHTRGPVRKLKSLGYVASYVLVEADINEQRVAFELQTPRLSFSEWFQHLRSMFKCDIDQIIFNDVHEIYNTVALRSLLPQWRSLEIDRSSHDFAQRILDVFCPCVKVIEARIDINLQELPQKVSIQNLDSITVGKPFTLDDALVFNAVEISLISFTVSDVNRFLRSWVRGSNPRMRSANILILGIPNREKLLKGITHQVTPVDQMLDEHGRVRERITIRNKKGIQATLNTVRHTFWTILLEINNM